MSIKRKKKRHHQPFNSSTLKFRSTWKKFASGCWQDRKSFRFRVEKWLATSKRYRVIDFHLVCEHFSKRSTPRFPTRLCRRKPNNSDTNKSELLKRKLSETEKNSRKSFAKSSRLRVLSIKSSSKSEFIALQIGSLIGEDFVVKLPLLTLDWWRR